MNDQQPEQRPQRPDLLQTGAGSLPAEQPGQPAGPAVGEQLAACRQERGWTIEQVASHLNLAPRQVLAIESDDFNALPGMAVARGFVRAYAKLLKIDPLPLLETMAVPPGLSPAAPGVRRSAADFAPARYTEIKSGPGRRLPRKTLALAAVVLVIGAGLWAVRHTGLLDSLPGSVEGGLAQLSGAPSAPGKANPDAVGTPMGSGAESSTSGTVTGEPVAPPAQLPPAAENQTTAATPAAPAAAATREEAAAPSAGTNVLVLKAREDSWIEVKGNGKRPLLSRLVKAGESESIDIKEPVLVLIGNAKGVDVSLRGEPVAVKSSGKGNIARLNLK